MSHKLLSKLLSILFSDSVFPALSHKGEMALALEAGSPSLGTRSLSCSPSPDPGPGADLAQDTVSPGGQSPYLGLCRASLSLIHFPDKSTGSLNEQEWREKPRVREGATDHGDQGTRSRPLPGFTCVTLGKLCNLPGPQFPHV